MKSGYKPRNIPKNNTLDITKDNIREITRLTPEVYAELERQCITASVTSQTTEIQAAAMVGAEMVLRKLRQGFVIGT